MKQSLRDKLNNSLPFTLIVLTIFFVLAQIATVVLLTPSNINYKVSSALVSGVIGNGIVLREIVTFVFAQCLLYAIVIYCLCLIASAIAYLFQLSDKQRIQIGVGSWILLVIAIVLLNCLLFPHSKFAFINHVPDKSAGLVAVCYVFFGSLGGLIVVALCGFIKWLVDNKNMRFATACLAGLCFTYFTYDHISYHVIMPTIKHDAPNIIILGIDSLRPDFLTRFGADNAKMPALDKFLKKATVFSNATTPLARTFPAWVSILTGLYPSEHGAKFNLVSFASIRREGSLAYWLKAKGYSTVYAIDERRFSNLDQSFGFDRVIGPKVGFNDFILGEINDFPLSNLVVNTRIGQWLFPYNYANRAAAVTYRPETFVKLFRRQMKEIDSRPVFLALHLCLPHWPFYWASDAGSPKHLISSARGRRLEAYSAALSRVDRQFSAIVANLKSMHLLDNAFVVVLSDHGESLGLMGDRVTVMARYAKGKPSTPRLSTLSMNEISFGHGIDALSMSAYHVLLAFRQFGKPHNVVRDFTFPVSLVDIKATIMDFLGAQPLHTTGISFWPYMNGKQQKAPPLRPIFIESGFTLSEFNYAKLSVKNLVAQGVDYYQVDRASGRLTIRPVQLQKLLRRKERGVIYGDWLLTIVPTGQARGQVSGRGILVNLQSGKWTDNLQANFAKTAPLKRMIAALKTHYQGELPLDIEDGAI